MKNLDNTYLVNNTVYSKGPSSCGYSFLKYFLKKNKDIKSILDIGCGGGVLMKLVNKDTEYLGVDADAGIYKKKQHKRLKYFKSAIQTENYLNKINKKYECVVLFDVLEHTDTFLKLFNIALKKSSKYVLIGLPNEDYIISRLRFLFGRGVMTHGLEMVNTKPGHKHQWLIQYKKAYPLLQKHGKKNKFNLLNTMFYVNQPKNFYKRIIYKTLLAFLPKTLQMNDFCLIFKKSVDS
jgi:SAM-dependent methyltransferase